VLDTEPRAVRKRVAEALAAPEKGSQGLHARLALPEKGSQGLQEPLAWPKKLSQALQAQLGTRRKANQGLQAKLLRPRKAKHGLRPVRSVEVLARGQNLPRQRVLTRGWPGGSLREGTKKALGLVLHRIRRWRPKCRITKRALDP
jgi:hypothetical protein